MGLENIESAMIIQEAPHQTFKEGDCKKMNHKSLFFKYVIPSIIAFALSEYMR